MKARNTSPPRPNGISRAGCFKGILENTAKRVFEMGWLTVNGQSRFRPVGDLPPNAPLPNTNKYLVKNVGFFYSSSQHFFPTFAHKYKRPKS